MIRVLWVFSDYEELRRAEATDPAWAADDGATNYRLKEGQRVMLRRPTVADSSTGGVLLGAGSVGVVIWARSPRVTQPKVRRPCTFLYFANIDFTNSGETYRARVPHNAVKVVAAFKTAIKATE